MAVDAYIYRRFNAWVAIDANGARHYLPTGEMVIKAVPYVGSGSTVERLFDGRRSFSFEGWEYEVELRWKQLTETDHYNLTQCVLDMIVQGDRNNGSVLYPAVQERNLPGQEFEVDNTKFIKVIPELTADTLKATFSNGFRKRPGSLKLVSFETPNPVLKEWII